jgi:hypothetical protein
MDVTVSLAVYFLLKMSNMASAQIHQRSPVHHVHLPCKTLQKLKTQQFQAEPENAQNDPRYFKKIRNPSGASGVQCLSKGWCTSVVSLTSDEATGRQQENQ